MLTGEPAARVRRCCRARRTLRCPARCRLFFPAPTAVTGPGRPRQWGCSVPAESALLDIRLQVHERELILNDSGGRSIHFEPLFPGEVSYSRSESFWLARGGVAEQHSSQPLSALWQVLPEDVRLSPHVYLATNSLQGPWWILSWPEQVPGRTRCCHLRRPHTGC